MGSWELRIETLERGVLGKDGVRVHGVAGHQRREPQGRPAQGIDIPILVRWAISLLAAATTTTTAADEMEICILTRLKALAASSIANRDGDLVFR